MSESRQAKLKWFDSKKGFGFLIVQGYSQDVFVHAKKLREAGYKSMPNEAGTEQAMNITDQDVLSCEVNEGPKGLFATNIIKEG